ncbi:MULTISPECIES: hypothetical protein [unclassified Paenibacillus]|uniref:hypothetical protein n=1 Tax=unclassified Paenibacillus TaxID=185978 RepID=UPI000897E15E|nr:MULTISPECIES: hypothetical protein [unclassified Paenibacillus]OMC68651.1 hypothetical protein BK126_12550 [Paenibacillus sp. FSL H7-0326]SDW56134.1 hypothetical protein SAMN05518848_102183 [Paenibacillus sp. PDC88]
METDKEREERELAEKLNAEAAERFKNDPANKQVTQEEADAAERAFFEDDEVITLRDRRKYRIPPCNLKDARRLMKLLKTVNVDAIILNFIPTDDEEQDEKRQQDLFDILAMAFKNYPHIVTRGEGGEYIVNRDYLDEYLDLNSTRKVIDILIGLNGLKK